MASGLITPLGRIKIKNKNKRKKGKKGGSTFADSKKNPTRRTAENEPKQRREGTGQGGQTRARGVGGGEEEKKKKDAPGVSTSKIQRTADRAGTETEARTGRIREVVFSCIRYGQRARSETRAPQSLVCVKGKSRKEQWAMEKNVRLPKLDKPRSLPDEQFYGRTRQAHDWERGKGHGTDVNDECEQDQLLRPVITSRRCDGQHSF